MLAVQLRWVAGMETVLVSVRSASLCQLLSSTDGTKLPSELAARVPHWPQQLSAPGALKCKAADAASLVQKHLVFRISVRSRRVLLTTP